MLSSQAVSTATRATNLSNGASLTLSSGKRRRIDGPPMHPSVLVRQDHLVPFQRVPARLIRGPLSRYQFIQYRSMYGTQLYGRTVNHGLRSLPLYNRYQCPDNQVYYFYFEDYSPCLPYSIDYAHHAMSGDLLAVSDEEGRVSLIRTDKTNSPADSEFHCTFYAHADATTDVKWSPDDLMLLTSGGDYMVRLFDVETQKCHAAFAGHMGVIRNANWHPTNRHLIVSASRSGEFNLWDTRCRQLGQSTDEQYQNHAVNFQEFGEYPVYGAVRSVSDAHVEKPKGGQGRAKGKNKEKIGAPRTVTCALFFGQDEDKVLTSGSLDGMIKLWDCRMGRSPHMIEYIEFKDAKGTPKGISNMKLDHSGSRLFSVCRDDTIYMHYLVDLTRPRRKFTSWNFRSAFSSELSLSHDDQYLIAGSADNRIFCWEVEGAQNNRAVSFDGHTDNVMSVAWHNQSNNQFASCSRDFKVRIWNAKSEVLRE
ncbi:WD40-repeat-containing domain protein [Gongronella butleri]|nr:WD40-repeat-containing domain protein [Gongronella butleri]